MSAKKDEYCYSFNGEDFVPGTYLNIKDALANAAEENDCNVVYVGKVVRPVNSDFFPSASNVLQSMSESAYEKGREYAANYPDVSPEALLELEEQLKTLLDAWCNKYDVTPDFYEVIDIKEYEINQSV